MKTMDLTEPGVSLAACVEALGHEPLALLQKGQPVAVLLPAEGTDLETLSLSLNPRFLALLEASRHRQQAEGGLSGEEMRRQLGLQPPGLDQKKPPRRSRTRPSQSPSERE